MSLAEETRDFGKAGLGPRSRAFGLLDVLGRNQVKDDRHESRILNPFVARRWVVDRDSRPENLPRCESATGWVETLVELVDFVGKEVTDSGTEDPRELGVQEMTQRAL